MQTVEAIWENGVLRPLEPLVLEDHQRVFLTIAKRPVNGPDAAAFFTPEEWEAALNNTTTIEEVWAAMSSIPGSLSDAVIEERLDRY